MGARRDGTASLRREHTLKQKASELATLCAVDACIFGVRPDGQLFFWPDDVSEFRRIAIRYLDAVEAGDCKGPPGPRKRKRKRAAAEGADSLGSAPRRKKQGRASNVEGHSRQGRKEEEEGEEQISPPAPAELMHDPEPLQTLRGAGGTNPSAAPAELMHDLERLHTLGCAGVMDRWETPSLAATDASQSSSWPPSAVAMCPAPANWKEWLSQALMQDPEPFPLQTSGSAGVTDSSAAPSELIPCQCCSWPQTAAAMCPAPFPFQKSGGPGVTDPWGTPSLLAATDPSQSSSWPQTAAAMCPAPGNWKEWVYQVLMEDTEPFPLQVLGDAGVTDSWEEWLSQVLVQDLHERV